MVEITAPRDYNPGDLIHEGEPFAYVLQRSLNDIFCEGCLKNSNNLKFCKECLVVKYCGKECQKSEWKNHKLECKHLKNLPENNKKDFVHLIGKVILKIKNERWKNIHKSVLGKITSFHDLDSHSEYLRNDSRMKLFCKEMRELTRIFIGNENMPNEDDFIEILGKVKFGTYPEFDRSFAYHRKYIFFWGASRIDGNCIPNCNMEVRRKTMKIWAIKSIPKGSKISIRNEKILAPVTTKEPHCTCADCSLPCDESILNRITDENRAYSVIVDTERLLAIRETLSLIDDDFAIEKNQVDSFLDDQRKVLGPTHALHLKTLALRCFQYDDHPIKMRNLLKELENNMRSVFGEFYLEMTPVYSKLMDVNFMLGNPSEAFMYMKKIIKCAHNP